MTKTILTICIGIGFVMAVGFTCQWLTSNEQEYLRGYQDGWNYIKSIKELQQQVGAVPDGIWGKETDRLYDKAVCNRYAEKYFEGIGQ